MTRLEAEEIIAAIGRGPEHGAIPGCDSTSAVSTSSDVGKVRTVGVQHDGAGMPERPGVDRWRRRGSRRNQATRLRAARHRAGSASRKNATDSGPGGPYAMYGLDTPDLRRLEDVGADVLQKRGVEAQPPR